MKTIVNEYGTYYGDVNSKDEADGYGTMNWNDGSKYEGYWAGDKPCGHGKMTYPHGGSIEGEFKGFCLNGKITIRFIEGAVFTGTVSNCWFDESGKLTGLNYGTIEYLDGTYTGEVNGSCRRQGKGTLKYKDGAVFEGTWEDDHEKYGTLTFPGGTSMTGGFANGKFNGPFKIERLGRYFEGEFKDGYIDEKGRFIGIKSGTEHAKDLIYTGEVDEFLQPHGKGVMSHPVSNEPTVSGIWEHGKLKSVTPNVCPSGYYEVDDRDVAYCVMEGPNYRKCIFAGPSYSTPLYYIDKESGYITYIRDMSGFVQYTVKKLDSGLKNYHVFAGKDTYGSPLYTLVEDNYGTIDVIKGDSSALYGDKVYRVYRSKAASRDYDIVEL